jgi:hypothetical protein
VEKAAVAVNEHKDKVKELKDRYQYTIGVQEKEKQAQIEEEKHIEHKKHEFY